MASVIISPQCFHALKDKTVVMTGQNIPSDLHQSAIMLNKDTKTRGTTGIGAVAISQLADIGAKVVFGDIKDPEISPAEKSSIAFVKTDVADYASVLDLFKTAWSLHGRIDHVISNAGLVEIGQLFATGEDDAAIEEVPPTLVMDVNLRGTLFVTRVGVHFLRKSLKVNASSQTDASLLLVSSVAGFGEFPGLFQYSATKHGIYGLFRSTRRFLQETENIRVNMVLPNMTRTAMVTGVIALYESLDIPCNEPKDVANTMLHTLSGERSGEALYVSGSQTYELEKMLEKVKPEWLGQQVYDELMAGQTALGGGGNWTNRKGGKAEDYNERELNG